MLHSLRPAPGSRPSRKRVARGNSGKGGTTAGRGTKGQQSRTGKGRRFGFEGGQKPLMLRQPKLGGFKPPRRVSFDALNLGSLEKMLPAGTYSITDLVERRLVRKGRPVKLLARGEVSKAYVLEVHAASKTAAEAIRASGGEVRLISS